MLWTENARSALFGYDLCDCIAALLVSYGPSEGYRPPQDDISGTKGNSYSARLLCFQDFGEQIRLRVVADQVRIRFAAVVIEFVGLVVVGVFDEQRDGGA